MGRYARAIDRATIRHDYYGRENLMLWWSKNHSGLLASIPIDTHYNAVEWNLACGMTMVDRISAEDGLIYEIWEGNGYRNAIREEN